MFRVARVKWGWIRGKKTGVPKFALTPPGPVAAVSASCRPFSYRPLLLFFAMRSSLEQGWLSLLPATRGYNRWAERSTLIQDVDYGRELPSVKHKVLRKSKNRTL